MPKRLLLSLVCLLLCTLVASPGGAAWAEGKGFYKVYADSLNVRSEPARDADIIGSLKSGSVVAVAEEAHGWYKVKTGGNSGWVAGYYLKPSEKEATGTGTAAATVKSAPQSGGKLVVTASALRVRQGPGTDREIVTVVYAGDEVQELERGSGWVKISAGSSTGWVALEYVAAAGQRQAAVKTGELSGKVIVVDPGHGGRDPGMIGTTYDTVEKEINLQTALLLKDKLSGMGAEVVLTRVSNSDKPELSERAAMSRSTGADVFVSIHYNSSPSQASGTLTFYYGDRDKKLAHAVESRLAGGIGLKSNGIAFGDYHVLRENSRPAVLVELGFLSNAGDEATVRTESYRSKAAAAIAAGISDYLTR
ncbi:N-acetylmuramoyl-L-alanine amidase [Paenibacillus sp. IB182496]|uniref:N-acetylmuramoyl-L-alanine amidase n=1 Tax=Paenibacillus sabuli TaxID=2772509 RepID=A0A927GRG2_9BACL|nr:N-acetylmuramoyl-L-alanine amidase [Paenibacillus sabuli]MBD2844935.1 N-acetylmuramoyl-L-alanine amidase [Paenibacillus sabuli]